MAKWNVSYDVTYAGLVEIEADTAEDAEAAFWDMGDEVLKYTSDPNVEVDDVTPGAPD